MAEESRKSHLIAQMAQARARIGINAVELRHDFEFGRRFRSAFAHHFVTWLGGAGALGLLLARIAAPSKKIVIARPGKRKEIEKEAVQTGLLLTVAKFAFDLLRPVVTKWVTHQVADYASGKMNRGRRV